MNQSNVSGRPDSVQRLYDVFAKYPARPDMPKCDHCASDAEIARLCSTPLADLTADDLQYYAWHALGTVGEEVDFKHFLPRVFETMLFNGAPMDCYFDPEVLVGKLEYTHWERWPAIEREAISQFLLDWWTHSLADYPGADIIDTCLCAIAQAEDDLTPYLDHWRGRQDAAACQHLAHILNYCAKRLPAGRLFSPWWDGRPQQLAQACAWLMSDLTVEAIRQACLQYQAEPFAEQLANVLNWLPESRKEWLGRQ